MQGQQQPILRWPAVIHPSPPLLLGFPVPAPPTQSRPAANAEQAAEPAALAAAISALQAVDVSYL